MSWQRAAAHWKVNTLSYENLCLFSVLPPYCVILYFGAVQYKRLIESACYEFRYTTLAKQTLVQWKRHLLQLREDDEVKAQVVVRRKLRSCLVHWKSLAEARKQAKPLAPHPTP